MGKKRQLSSDLLSTRIHGSFLVDAPARPAAPLWLVGFHGYAENAEANLRQLKRIPGSRQWLLCAVQSLHLFYNSKTRDVVGSWMTRQHRLQAIEDNIAYVSEVLERLEQRCGRPDLLVLLGFSQGASMAYRAAARCDFPIGGLVILAGDVPPDVVQRGGAVLPPVLLGRGLQDPWYTEEKMQADLQALKTLAARVETCLFEAGHQWSEDFSKAAGRFLAELRKSG